MVDSACSADSRFDTFPGYPFDPVCPEALAGFEGRCWHHPDASPAGVGHCVQDWGGGVVRSVLECFAAG